MSQRSFALDGVGIVHVMLPPLRDNDASLRVMCDGLSLLVVEGPATCMQCVGIEMHITRTAAFINDQLRHLLGQPFNETTANEAMDILSKVVK